MSQHRTGTRSNRRKRGLIRRVGIVFPVAVFAVVAVIGVAVGAAVFSPGSGAFNIAQAVEAGPGSHTIALLEAERAQLTAMTTAARTLTVVVQPKLASPAEVAAATTGNGNGAGTGGGGIVYVTSTPPNPNTAQSIAYNLMASFGFSPTTYFGCLLDLWNRESGWRYDAENPSGAYGIPQADLARRCPAPDLTGRRTRPPRSSGAWATSSSYTEIPAARGLSRKPTGTTDRIHQVNNLLHKVELRSVRRRSVVATAAR